MKPLARMKLCVWKWWTTSSWVKPSREPAFGRTLSLAAILSGCGGPWVQPVSSQTWRRIFLLFCSFASALFWLSAHLHFFYESVHSWVFFWRPDGTKQLLLPPLPSSPLYTRSPDD